MTTPAAIIATDPQAPPDLRPLWSALLEFQRTVRVLKRNQRNEFTGSDYLDMAGLLEAIGPALSDAGLVLIQSPTLELLQEGRPIVELETRLVHAETGAELRNVFRCPVKSADAQAVGSAVSYSRRYSAMAMLGLASERDSLDDDGNAASDRRAEGGRAPRREPPPRREREPAPAKPRAVPARAEGNAPDARGPDGAKPSTEDWRLYGQLASNWRNEPPSRAAVLAWADNWRRCRKAPIVTAALLQEGVQRLRAAFDAPDTPPERIMERREWERVRADGNEAAGLLADGHDPGPHRDRADEGDAPA